MYEVNPKLPVSLEKPEMTPSTDLDEIVIIFGTTFKSRVSNQVYKI